MFNIQKYHEIKEKIEKNKLSSSIVAISKNHPKSTVIEAINYGVKIFGENRVMEAKQKFEEIVSMNTDIELHLTGPLQSNKVKKALDLFNVFHTVDREKIVNELSKHKDKLKNKKFFVQVNTGKEKTKSGIYPEDLNDFLNFCIYEKKINIFGLMCIPPLQEPPKNHFEILKNLATDNNLINLSIGMSNDYEEALTFNPKFIRLGTVLFGSRHE